MQRIPFENAGIFINMWTERISILVNYNYWLIAHFWFSKIFLPKINSWNWFFISRNDFKLIFNFVHIFQLIGKSQISYDYF